MFVLASSSLSLTPTHSPSFSLFCLPFPWVDILLPAAVVTTAASINRNHRPRHQVKPHQRPLHLQVPPQTLVHPLCPYLHLPLRLRALAVLEDDRGPCFDSRRGSSRWPSVVLASRNAATGGSAQPKKVRVRVKEKGRRTVPLARRGRAAGGGRKTTHGRGGRLAAVAQPSVLSPPTPARDQAGPTHACRSKHGQQTLYRAPRRLPMLTCPPSRVMAMVDEQRKGQRRKQRRSTTAYGFARQVHRLAQGVIKNTPFSR